MFMWALHRNVTGGTLVSGRGDRRSSHMNDQNPCICFRVGQSLNPTFGDT
jgi:hypothetical protein